MSWPPCPCLPVLWAQGACWCPGAQGCAPAKLSVLSQGSAVLWVTGRATQGSWGQRVLLGPTVQLGGAQRWQSPCPGGPKGHWQLSSCSEDNWRLSRSSWQPGPSCNGMGCGGEGRAGQDLTFCGASAPKRPWKGARGPGKGQEEWVGNGAVFGVPYVPCPVPCRTQAAAGGRGGAGKLCPDARAPWHRGLSCREQPLMPR